MKTRLNMNKIAAGLGAERRGRVSSSGGYFGAVQLRAEIDARFRVPTGGGRATDPRWTERRLVPLAPRTLRRLEVLTEEVRRHEGVNVKPMQLAALLLEKTAERVSEEEVSEFVRRRRRAVP